MVESNRVVCASRVDRVTLYARGAVVTRVVTVPEALPPGPCALELDAGRALFDGRSLRAEGVGARPILALDARPVDRSSRVELGPIAAEIERVKRELDAVRERRARWAERQSGLASVWPDPRLRPRKRSEDAAARIDDGLAVSALSEALLEAAHEEIDGCDARERSLTDALRALEVRYAQGSSAGEGRDVERAMAILVQLGASEDGSSLTALEVEYVVDAARWWPAYKVRLSDGARRAQWSLDAYIAQSSGEDWTDALVSLSTADLVRDVRLPTLASLRLGRAQPPKRAYRPPPQGLDELFAGYDAAQAKPAPPSSGSAAYEGPSTTRAAAVEPPKPTLKEALLEQESDGVAFGSAGAYPEEMAKKSAPPSPAAFAAPMAAPAMMAKMDFEPQASRSRGGRLMSRDEGAAAPKQQFAAVSGELDPDEQWLDYDGLALSDPRDAAAQRGRLTRGQQDPLASVRSFVLDAIEQKRGPSGTVDPRDARGMFDHRYEGTARVDVRSDGALHRVSVAQAEGHSKPKFRLVAKEAAEVYREAEVQNPFDAPLLGGPAEVFYDDALIARAQVAPGDRGSTIALGLGLEERIRVARNAKVHEASAGLLGGTTQVDHTVTIELSSSLGEAVTVDVIDRVPTAKKGDEVEVTMTSARPKPQVYTQAERGAPIEGGLKWALDVAAGAKASVEFSYRITFSSKLELEGGNRRD